MLACILTIIGWATLTSCTNDDNPVDLQKKVVGKWFAEYAKAGTEYGTNNTQLTFVKMMQYYEFNADGTGVWVAFPINADGNAITIYGGLLGDENADGYFHYTTKADGTVSISLDNKPEEEASKTLRIVGNKLTGSDDGIAYTLQPATEDQEMLILNYCAKWDLGGDGDNDVWNWGHPGEDR